MVQHALEAGREAAAKIGKYSTRISGTSCGSARSPRRRSSSAASASGGVGKPKEAATLAAAFAELKKTAPATSIFSLAAEKTPTAADLKSLPTDRNALLALYVSRSRWWPPTTPAKSAAYGQSLVDLATTVAEATKEGGFLGIGGTRISEAEQVAINQVKAVAQPGPRSTV